MTNDYEIGYGKPPKDNQFKPGESGNKKGRPKGRKNLHTLLDEILNQKIIMKENGKTIRVSKKTAMLLQLVNKGVKGDTKAILSLAPYISIADIKAEERVQVLKALSKNDTQIVKNFVSDYKEEQK